MITDQDCNMDFLVTGSGRQNFGMDDDIVDFFSDNDHVFSPSSTTHNDYIHDDWFKNLFDDPILNDKMITDAAQPRIQSEHSYSIDSDIHDTATEDFPKDFCNDFFPSANGALDLSQKSTIMIPAQPPCLQRHINVTTSVHTPSHVTRPNVASKVPGTPTTIIITSPGDNTSSCIRQAQTLIPRAHIKVEPVDALDQVITDSGLEGMLIPLTPPHSSTSSSSDSEGSLSPQRSAPSSPQMSSPFSPNSKPFLQPIFTNPIPTSGVLILTEEEKRTLIQEGYPIPSKLPLTKNEEKNLKKIRRKIKNKISAQESRRKKKEYLELLEKQVECYTHENSDLKRKVNNLESSNKSLMGQLQKLQSLVSKYTSTNVTSTPAGSVLMVVVLCFAMFLGNWEPSSLNIGYNVGPLVVGHEGISRPNPIHPAPSLGPSVQTVYVDSYSTPNMKSRMLLSTKDECMDDEGYGPRMPLLNPEMCERADDDDSDVAPSKSPLIHTTIKPSESLPHEARVYVSPESDVNETRETTPQYASGEIVVTPDIATPALRNVTVGRNMS